MDNLIDSSASRRSFLKGATAAAAGAALTRLAPASALGAGGRIRMGWIGVGNMGRAHLKWFAENAKTLNLDIVAVADVYTGSKDKAKKILADNGITIPDERWFGDYRKLLALADVDAVLIATPEHWHCKMGLDALAAGKDIYLEKPLTLTLAEANLFYDEWKAKYQNRVIQVGNQNSTDPKWLRINKLIPQIGKVVWSQNSYCRNTPAGEWNVPPIPKGLNPAEIDWKMFLGTEFGLAPDRPFDADRFFHWRKYWDYSSGICGDLLAHRIFPFLIALYGDKPQLPKRVSAMGGNYVHKTDREVPDTLLLTADYPDDHSIFLAGSTENEQGVVPMIRGQKGFIEMLAEAGGKIRVTPERAFAEDFDPMEEAAPEVDSTLHNPHRKNFIDCVRSRQRPTCHMEIAYAGMVTLCLADLSYKHSIVAQFDPVKRVMLNPVKGG